MAAILRFLSTHNSIPSHSSLFCRNPKPFSSSFLLSVFFSSRNPNPNGLTPVTAVPPSRAASAAVAPPPAIGELLELWKLGISEQIVSALSSHGITEFFPIQRAVLEAAMEGRDMIGKSITISGKTLAFGIPILDKIIRHQSQDRRKRVTSALVLAPTSCELAREVQQEFKVSAPSLSSTYLFGGISISNQLRTLGLGMDIVVGTPGRIIDLVERGALDLSEVKFVLLDEADQMLAIGFQEDVKCILGYFPATKQCMLLSATMPSWVNDMSRKYLRDPLVVDLVDDSDQKIAEGISLYSVASVNANKQSLLPTLISLQGLTGSVGARTDMGYESDDDLVSRSPKRSDYSYNHQYGNYGRSPRSSASRYPESNFRRNYSSSSSQPRSGSHSSRSSRIISASYTYGKIKNLCPKYLRRPVRSVKRSEYRIRLEEKQKLRYHYCVSKGQIRRYTHLARKAKGSILQLLEMRLDSVIFRLGMASSIPGARQLVKHKHILVNGRIVDIARYHCKPEDIITMKDKQRSKARN